MDAFQPALRNRPIAEPAEREVLRQLVPGSRIVEASQLRTLPDDGAIWLWNSQLDQGDPVTIGAPVDQQRLTQIPIGDPLRLIRVDSGLWTTLMDPDLEAPRQSQHPDALPSAGDRYADLLPPPQGERVLPELVPSSDQGQSSAKWSQRLRELAHLAKRWPAWRCLPSTTTFRLDGM